MGISTISRFNNLIYCLILILAPINIVSSLPVISPHPCKNHITKESGVCMFNWSCIHVAHGVHIAPCLDRYLIGSCCKLPTSVQKPNVSTQEINETAINEQQNVPETQINKGPVYSVHEVSVSNSSESQERKIQVVNRDWFSYTQEHNKKHASVETNDLMSGSKSKNSSLHNFQKFDITDLFHEVQKPLISESSHNVQRPVITESSHNMGKPVDTQPSHDMRTPMAVEPSHDMHKLVAINSSHNMRKPVAINPSHNMRKPVAINPSHNMRKPMLPELFHHMFTPVIPRPSDAYGQALPSVAESLNPTSQSIHKPFMTEFFYDVVKPSQGFPNGSKVSISDISPGYEYRQPSIDVSSEQQRIGGFNGSALQIIVALTHRKPITDVNSGTEMPTQDMQLGIQKLGIISESAINNQSSHFSLNNAFTQLHSTHAYTLNPLSTSSTSMKNSNSNIKDSFLGFSTPLSISNAMSYLQSNNLQRKTPASNSTGCGVSPSFPAGRIVGGRKAKYLKWPWMISLRRLEGKSYKHKCGAALLNQFWAITVAHCVDRKLPSEIVLHLGDYNLHDSHEFHPHLEQRVYLIVVHPAFNPLTYENDLALLRFYRPVQSQANIVPVCLSKDDDLHGKTAVVTGWGRLSEDGELPGYLHEVHIPILDNKECERMYAEAGYFEKIPETFVCAGLSTGGLDACEGDSGGPMVLKEQGRWSLVGLISWGMGCAAPRQPGVYVRISSFIDWINEVILI